MGEWKKGQRWVTIDGDYWIVIDVDESGESALCRSADGETRWFTFRDRDRECWARVPLGATV